jgi:hypothetical protein
MKNFYINREKIREFQLTANGDEKYDDDIRRQLYKNMEKALLDMILEDHTLPEKGDAIFVEAEIKDENGEDDSLLLGCFVTEVILCKSYFQGHKDYSVEVSFDVQA